MIVLCIDNEPKILDGMETLLGGWGCQVLKAPDLKSALTTVSEAKSVPNGLLATIVYFVVAVGFTGMNELRARKSLEVKQKSYSLTSYVHESVCMHDDVAIEENCTILDHVSIHPGCNIGRGTFISSNVNIGHGCMVGANNWINSGVAIAGGCRLGVGCFFGVNSSAAQGLRIGARNFIAANTLVNKHTEDDQVYLSEPGQLFRLKSQSFLGFSRLAG